jgi:hypothetical protein
VALCHTKNQQQKNRHPHRVAVLFLAAEHIDHKETYMSITLPQPYEPGVNPAVQHCLDAWQETLDRQVANGIDEYSAARSAHKAYRLAMPNPDSDQTIRDFIACVSRGILIGAIKDSDAARLLYAAQVARQACGTPAKSQRESGTKKPIQPESASSTEQAVA